MPDTRALDAPQSAPSSAPGAGAGKPRGHNDITGFLITHDLIRRAVPEFARRWSAAPLPDPDAARRLSAWWDMFTTILHGHHTGEDDHVWPAILVAAPDLAGVAAALEDQHDRLDEHLSGIEDGLCALRDGGADATALVERLTEFDRVMADHLALEEDHMVPVLRDDVTPGDYGDMLGRMRTGHDPADFARTMPLLLEDASIAANDLMLGGMPPGLRRRYDTEWLPAYRELARSLPPDAERPCA